MQDPKVILPSRFIPVDLIETPLFFLAGPVRGAADWQANAALMLTHLIDPDRPYVAIPCRYSDSHHLFKIALKEQVSSTPFFHRQTSWERYYLELASRLGCIVFWLPEESKTNPRPKEAGPYGRDTYGELGEWRARASLQTPEQKVNLVVGAEPGFPGLDVITENFRAMLGDSFQIYNTLTDTMQAAVKKARS